MITVEKLTIKQGDFCLNEIDLSVPTGQYGILMGATGSGKTTLIESLCGLRKVLGGRILLGDRDVTNEPASTRQIGYVPQDSALFPAMRVDQQIEFGLQVRHVDKSSRRQRVGELASLLDIESLLQRYPAGLSGGERQRVAIARALSFRPQLLCLDEPLSSLDDTTRTRLVKILRDVHHREKVTILHITHNSAEAKELGTVQFELKDGRITKE